ncbi:MAG: OadG family protein [Clostridia bacterium]|nr:OadG family protein [Clostridia bacterium]
MLFNVLTPSALALFTTDAETLTMMWQTVVLGMGMVFAVLAILWAILSIFKLIFAGKSPKEPKPVKQKPVKEKPAEAKAESVTAPTPAAQDDGALIAVITAAVAAYMAETGEEVPVGGFRVVSFTRVRGGKPWNSK